ncbi:MAG: tRNA (guanosine(37)-N1)-methyltransferase TrmD [Desulfobacterales bacterium]|nr:tRNA (guanosine(37)-N1)-methyltransferase TrmD [Desulfobacterales bacterium]
MEFYVLTIFPEMIDACSGIGVLKKAIEQKKISVQAVNIRDYTFDRHKSVDDTPYGGGVGMVMKPEPLMKAIQDTQKKSDHQCKTIFLSPQGKTFNQNIARELALYHETQTDLILICGRYEGIDERICNEFIDDELSIGDYVLTGGELAALIIVDAVSRLIPGVLGNDQSADEDTFSGDLIKHAQYTRPYAFEGMTVPDVLLSGNHKDIYNWRLASSLIKTFFKRPDLLEQRNFSVEEINILTHWSEYLQKIIQHGSIHCTNSLSST